ncbi:uncharacterized protein BYT42DRAFT_503340 [Radiomyces spectabilis]|uniref:uncharacterized protein n=1 Tax=Radiomyces spectabilis TaxID=64574 RepID=UPI00221F5772|nr:uncharacterized protein BYT42DRAFT_503340 [Radiomyces spectabilis]KAI8369400.1 hypothetical protein BYT42DRAFT_503340 [Radiomyces spectabilis]
MSARVYGRRGTVYRAVILLGSDEAKRTLFLFSASAFYSCLLPKWRSTQKAPPRRSSRKALYINGNICFSSYVTCYLCLAHSFITVWNRKTQFNDGRIIEWDIAGHQTPYPTFITVFTFNTSNQSTCLLKEFAQGTNEIKYTCVAGSYDRRKHTRSVTAQHELSEEAQLTGGEWICLLPEDQPDGISELKWGKNRFVPYLCINPHADANPRQRDLEECIEIVDNVSTRDLKTFITKGHVMLPSVQTAWMALEYLAANNMLN